MIRTVRGLALLLLISALANHRVGAQVHPIAQRGFAAERVFQVGDIDSVNLFSGSLVLAVPIGPGYSTGGGFSYRLYLAYNSRIWDYQEDVSGVQSVPVRNSNAGQGWLLTLGEVLKAKNVGNPTPGNFVYLSSDGGEHTFYPTLHDGETVVPGRQYTRDGTYIRLSGLFGTRLHLEFPNGQRHIFNDSGDSYRLERIEDPFGNFLNVTYVGQFQWNLEDNYGRIHKVFFTSSVHYPKKLDRIELKTAHGMTSTWRFDYQNVQIAHGCPDTGSGSVPITVPLLTRIIQPDGTFWDMPVATSYYVETGVPCSDIAGRIKGVTLPTRGRVEWTYRKYLQVGGSACEGGIRSWIQLNEGVATRTVLSGLTSGTWTYSSQLDFHLPQPIGCNPPRAQITKVVTPLGHVERHYFSIYRTGVNNFEGWKTSEMGLPFTRYTNDGAGRFLSREIYGACDPDVSACQPERSYFVRYEQDQIPPDDTVGSIFNVNSRLASQRTRYDSDGGKTADSDFSGFDGFGHYRTEQTNGTFPGENRRTTFTHFNPEAGTYNAGGGGTFQMRGPFDPWVLETYTEKTVGEGGGSSKSKEQYCFEKDGATGLPRSLFLERRRVYFDEFGTTPNNKDLVAVYQRDSQGNLIREDSYGGDKVPLNTSTGLCSASYTNPQFGMIHQPPTPGTAWVRTASPTTAAGVAFSFKTTDETVDPNTGLVVSSRDMAGLQTTYSYDVMSRLLQMLPAQEARTDYVYTLPTETDPGATPQVQILRKNGAVSLAESQYQFDGLGRVWREKKRIPGQGLQTRETLYDGMGHVASVSELGSITEKTESLDYDPFGRPGTMRLADGKETTYQYFGDRSKVRFVNIGTTWNGTNVTEQSARVDELFDRFGRLHSVKELSGAGGTGVVTSYTYDSAGRLNQVSTPSAGTTQVRTFSYDNRGFLNSETHPEKVGAVTYSEYDAKGHAGRKVDGPNNLQYLYDRAERLTEVRETSQGNRLLKSFAYAGPTTNCGWCHGKLLQASRWNYTLIAGSPFTVEIREALRYDGTEGRVSSRTTENWVNAGASPNEKFSFSQTYTPLGLVQSISYPQCTHAACGNPAPRSQAFTFTDGTLTQIPGYASSISYHSNGMPHQVVHQNNPSVTVTDTIGLDPDGMTRPASITAARGASLLWNTGAYQYDGAGNVKRIGPSYYTYDLVSRLTFGSVNISQGITTPTFKTQGYVFDAFGNIQQISTNGIPTNTPTTSATNRLSAPSTYDNAGNLTNWLGNQYEVDGLNMIRRYRTAAGEEWTYLYTPDDERIWSYKTGGTDSRWTLRGFDAKVLREYVASSGWQVANDYIYRDGQLLASDTPTPATVRHFHLDHLGTPRLITDVNGIKVAYHAYYPFGQEATAVAQDGERMKFTGHERDLANGASEADDLDYMHARFCSPLTGRFLSVDPVLQRAIAMRQPQQWNRFVYALGNPLRWIDPTGQSVWRTVYRVIKQLSRADDYRRITIATIRENSKSKTIERTKKALDSIDHSERSRGARRVVVAENREARDAMANQLSDAPKARPQERSGDFPEHRNPKGGPYKDVHVETAPMGKLAVVAAILTSAAAPATSAVIESGDATPGELLSAAGWDAISAIDPTGVSDLISMGAGIE